MEGKDMRGILIALLAITLASCSTLSGVFDADNGTGNVTQGVTGALSPNNTVSYEIFVDTPSSQGDDGSQGPGNDGDEGQGTFVLAISSSDISRRISMDSLTMSIEDVSLHGESGWQKVESSGLSFDTVQLEGDRSMQVVARGEVPAGDYDGIRFRMADADAMVGDDRSRVYMPSDEIRVMADFSVEEGTTTAAVAKLDMGESLHMADMDRLVLAPSMEISIWEDAQVPDDGDEGSSRAIGGSLVSDNTIGMDSLGRTGIGRRIEDDADLYVQNGRVFEEGIDSAGSLYDDEYPFLERDESPGARDDPLLDRRAGSREPVRDAGLDEDEYQEPADSYTASAEEDVQ